MVMILINTIGINMKKQSSVEWLEQQLNVILKQSNIEIENVIWQQAKTMHKEEMIESYCQGCLDMTNDDTIFPRETSEQYYNEKFEK